MKTSLDEGTPAATVQEPDLGRVFDVAAYGKQKTKNYHFTKSINILTYKKKQKKNRKFRLRCKWANITNDTSPWFYYRSIK